MPDTPELNSAIEGSSATDALSIGMGPSAAMSMTYSAMSSSLAIVMHNAATAERSSQQIAQANVITTCAMIIAKAGS